MVKLRFGVLGFSEGNGHPFSFSAIVNGYSEEGFRASGWSVIHEYLRAQDPAEIGTLGARVTHVWTQDPLLSRAIATACLVDSVVSEPADMLGSVDAVMILRDDPESHYELARPFLLAGLPVFVDKPLAIERSDLRAFLPALEGGQVFSTSGFRFARELDELRSGRDQFGRVFLVRAAAVKDWVRYGVHMIDAVLGVLDARPVAVSALPAHHHSFAVELSDGTLLEIDCLGEVPKVFRLDFYCERGQFSVELGDNFAAFRRTIVHFVEMVNTKLPPVAPADTVASMKTLIAGLVSRSAGRRVYLSEVEV